MYPSWSLLKLREFFQAERLWHDGFHSAWPPLHDTYPLSGPCVPSPFTLAQLVNRSEAQLAKTDLIEMNLAVAAGLPGAARLDRPALLAKVDEMAEAVAAETERFRPNFRPNPSCPTEAHYRLYMVVKVCRDHFGLRHVCMPEKGTGFVGIAGEPTPAQWRDARNWFVHGLLGPERIGSCTSMSVLYAAVGRRLGYPIRLVLAVSHAFIRWDDGRERINMEGTGPDYISSPADEMYIDQPRPWTQREKTDGYYLRSIRPHEELALMLATRAGVQMSSDHLLEAGFMISRAYFLAPNDPNYAPIARTIEFRLAALPAHRRPRASYCPPLDIGFDGQRFYEPGGQPC